MRTRMIAVILVLAMAMAPVVLAGEDLLPLWQGLKKIEKINLKAAAKAALQEIVSDNPGVISRMQKKTFSKVKNPPLPLPWYKFWKVTVVTTPELSEAYGKNPELYIAVNPDDPDSYCPWGLMIYPGTPQQKFLGWYD